jgi:hypothetical protein
MFILNLPVSKYWVLKMGSADHYRIFFLWITTATVILDQVQRTKAGEGNDESSSVEDTCQSLSCDIKSFVIISTNNQPKLLVYWKLNPFPSIFQKSTYDFIQKIQEKNFNLYRKIKLRKKRFWNKQVKKTSVLAEMSVGLLSQQ